MTFRVLISAIALLGLLVLGLVRSNTAQAQSSDTIRFEAIDLVGKVRRPEASILVSRKNLSEPYQLELKESFIPKIVESVERKPF